MPRAIETGSGLRPYSAIISEPVAVSSKSIA